MPRLSLKTVLLRAIDPALQDRESLADCHSKRDPFRAVCLENVERIKALRVTLQESRKPVTELPEDLRSLCFSVLVWAAQWEDSVADANHRKGAYAKQCMADAQLFKSTRLKHFGPSRLEADLEKSELLDIKSGGETAPARQRNNRAL